MALNKLDLKAGILKLIAALGKDNITAEAAAEKFAEDLAEEIDIYVKSAEVNTTGTGYNGFQVVSNGSLT